MCRARVLYNQDNKNCKFTIHSLLEEALDASIEASGQAALSMFISTLIKLSLKNDVYMQNSYRICFLMQSSYSPFVSQTHKTWMAIQ